MGHVGVVLDGQVLGTTEVDPARAQWREQLRRAERDLDEDVFRGAIEPLAPDLLARVAG